jgi:peptidoglycan-N-acetylglucosamine deacetylase
LRIIHLLSKPNYTMDSDPESYFNSSMLFKATVLTISFTTIYFYKQGQHFLLVEKPVVQKDTLVKVNKSKPASKKKTIYLTFDDGPCKGSKTFFSILQQEKVVGSFFVIGEHVYGSKEQLSIYNTLKNSSLIELSNHSYSHAFQNKFYHFYNAPDSANNDFKRCADSLHFTNNIIRTPGRNIWRTENIHSTDLKASSAAGDTLKKNGFIAIGWDVEWHYNNKQRIVEDEYDMIKNIDSAFAHNYTKTTNHLVLLTHDRTFANPDDSSKLHRFITALKIKNEYGFELVSQYPHLSKDTTLNK